MNDIVDSRIIRTLCDAERRTTKFFNRLLASGCGDSSILGVTVPPFHQSFLDLGRFRTSLLLDALERDKRADAKKLDRLIGTR